jgi:diguanylate cyclase (GGDEF)-like protein
MGIGTMPRPGVAMVSGNSTEARRQVLRLRRALVAAGGCAAFVAVAWVARDAGLVALGPVGFWVLFGPWFAVIAGLAALIFTGRNLSRRDPSLTLPQILWAACGPVMLYPFVPEIAGISHLGLLSIGLFGAFRLSNARYLLTNLGLLFTLGVAFVVQQALWADRGDLTAALIGYAGFALALGVVTMVGFELNGFRHKLTERNDELTLAFDRLRDLAVRDELTGIHNRRFLMEALGQQKALADRSPGHHFTLCFVDIDHFKRVNDVFGHARGDLVLRQFAQIAAHAVRDVDYVARLGGEEFVLVLIGTDAEGARIVADRVRDQLGGLGIAEELPDFRITASCGITEYVGGEPIETTMSRADSALYRAKHAGRDQIVMVQADETDPESLPVALAVGAGEGREP